MYDEIARRKISDYKSYKSPEKDLSDRICELHCMINVSPLVGRRHLVAHECPSRYLCLFFFIYYYT
jgi:hypothetical protein